ncbi:MULTISPECIES: hypothetical protein [Cyanophyceae]|uniref:hypothetical protein n=1 Tax=Cyanophyceae TaxID=3028117 RepID=UPI0016837693|nr:MULTISPECIES: hypothetical protein [Cyanophyceae]MBD1916859.1 hypothetical protein [Phormidium sp. FACHB-77]MBD2029490.1 hypothetical protein [Phormidium sp. FACHB-322]MBD2052066.1 hypothetical protein [Leptolyngbya sp. FACHB-60]
MKNIFGTLKEMLSRIYWKQFAVACSAIVILLTANGVKAEQNATNRAYSNELPPTQDVGRPRTMGQWEAENESLEGQPGKKLKRIAEESADAVKNMAEIYPQNARTLTPGVGNGELPNDD